MNSILNEHILLKDALIELNKKSEVNDSLVLFIVDENKKLVGTLTDGDIRRFLFVVETLMMRFLLQCTQIANI